MKEKAEEICFMYRKCHIISNLVSDMLSYKEAQNPTFEIVAWVWLSFSILQDGTLAMSLLKIRKWVSNQGLGLI